AKMGDSDSDEEEMLQYKIILLGDGTVGKTSIAMRFTNDEFGQQYKQTIGLDFMLKRLELPGKVNVALQIWDIGGQSIGSKMLGNYIYGSQAILICYDITNHQSFQNAEDWLSLVKNVFKEPGSMPTIALVGNKCDMSHLRSVKAEKHTSFVEANNMKSFFVSAKTGDSVNSTFYRIASDLCGITLTRPEVRPHPGACFIYVKMACQTGSWPESNLLRAVINLRPTPMNK
ncbi:ras-related protein rab-28-like protein, partial [Baffinella frigidus]